MINKLLQVTRYKLLVAGLRKGNRIPEFCNFLISDAKNNS